jgi:hypothetical protein
MRHKKSIINNNNFVFTPKKEVVDIPRRKVQPIDDDDEAVPGFLRVHFHYDPSEMTENVTLMLKDIQKFLQDRIDLVPTDTVFRSKTHDVQIKVPLCYGWSNVYAPMVTIDTNQTDLYIHLKKTNVYCNDPGIIAYETHCNRDESNGRPYNIFIGLCEDAFFKDHLKTHQQRYWALLHEVIHGLGFDEESFAKYYPVKNRFVSPVGYNYLYTRGCFTRGYTRKEKRRKRGMFLGKNSVQYVQKHFKCDRDLDYVEMEFNGGSHVSERLFHDDLMTPVLDKNYNNKVANSKLIFNMLKDSGWYTIKKDAELKDGRWGKHTGCDFVHMHCRDYYFNTLDEKFFYFKNPLYFDDYDKYPARIYEYRNGNKIFAGKHKELFTGEPNYAGLESMEYCPIRKKYNC